MKLIGAEDVRWVTDGRPVSVEVQAIPPRAAVRVRVDDGHTEHFDVLAVDSDALMGGVVANPNQIWLEVIVGLDRAVSAEVWGGWGVGLCGLSAIGRNRWRSRVQNAMSRRDQIFLPLKS